MTFSLHQKIITASLATLCLSACATSELTIPTSLNPLGNSVNAATKVTVAAAQVQGWCFTPPDRRDFDRIVGELTYRAERQNWQNNQNKYEICRLQTPAKQLVAAAEVSKFTLIEIAEAMTAIADAENLKSDTINAIAERLKATSATDIDIKAENEKLSAELAKLQAEKSARDGVVELSPQAYEQIEIAKARLDSASHYLGQTLGTTIVIYRSISSMSEAQRESVYNEAAMIYGGGVESAAFDGFVNDLGSIAEGTISGAGGLMTAAFKIGDVEAPENMGDISASVESARTVSSEQALEIVQKIDNGSLT